MAVLVIEDDVELLDILCFALRRDGHDVIGAHDGEAGLRLFKGNEPQLVLLDLNLPKLSGWEVCKQIRRESTTPVIMLTANASERDVINGLDAGADDYITKPFSPSQLLARVRAVLRRRAEAADQPRQGWQTITAGDLTLDPGWRSAHRGTESVQLTPTEFKLLYELMLHERQVLTHQTLTDRVWGYEGVSDSSLLKGHVRNLRRKLQEHLGSADYIRTVVGVGYTFQRHQSNGVQSQPAMTGV